jgi:mono/diheme cytochrome c family protein
LFLAGNVRTDDRRSPANAAAGGPGQVAALFKTRCARCHGGAKPKANLDLSSLAGISRGGRDGAVIVPGKLDESLMWQMVRENKMPPKEPLDASERQVLRRWIEQGAPGLRAGQKPEAVFRPPSRPPLPLVRRTEALRTNVDQFVHAALEENGLSLGPEADRQTLIRRVALDLTGLPPTLAEIDAFLADNAPGVYERMVERYLASPHYGERWGKYWLDAAGYADSNGYFDADTDRPLAYKYRDYVIRSLNHDKPYDGFVAEQLAGDELAGYATGRDVTPAMIELLTATHFLRNAPDGTGESDGNPDEVRTDRYTVLEGNLQVTMNCLLGITIQCARCHSHKFEPITQEEYYRLEAILYPVYFPDRWIKPQDRKVILADRGRQEEYKRLTERINRQTEALKASLVSLMEPFREQVIEERLQNLEPSRRTEIMEALRTKKNDRSARQKALLAEHVEPLKVKDDEVGKRFPEVATVREQIQQAIAAREKERPRPLDAVAAVVDLQPNPPAHHLLLRGQHNAPGPEVQPGVPAALCTPANCYRLESTGTTNQSSGRRTALARWITSPDHPLFARVMVNRIWQHHFGVGIVASSDNLGQSGARASHPELLDFLATELIRSGWSVKAIHRLILRSTVYRQASAFREEAFEADPDNRLLWRFPLRRLDAEALRDSMLAVTGELDPRPGGPYVPTKRTGTGVVEIDQQHEGARRRSIYLQQRRTQTVTMLELFDAPAMTPSCGVRNTSTVPLQSLALLNSDFARACGRAFAGRLDREAGTDTGARIRHSFRLTVGRPPTPDELAAAQRFLETQNMLYAGEKDGVQRAWTDFCQMILASNMFLYVE